MQKQRLTSDDGELLTNSLVESSEIFAQSSDKKKKRGELQPRRGAFLRSGTFWGVALGYAFTGYGVLALSFVLLHEWWYAGAILWTLGIPAFLIGLSGLVYFSRRRSWHAAMGQFVGIILLFIGVPLFFGIFFVLMGIGVFGNWE